LGTEATYSLRVAIFEFWAAEGILKAGVERAVLIAAAGAVLRARTLRILERFSDWVLKLGKLNELASK
jgi:hypothetical protein